MSPVWIGLLVCVCVCLRVTAQPQGRPGIPMSLHHVGDDGNDQTEEEV